MRRLALILAFSPILAQAQGPIETRNHQAASLAFLRFEPRASLLSSGEHSFSAGFTVANSLRFNGDVREDHEVQRLSLRYGKGFERGEWRIELPFLGRNGGFLDPIIDSYHRLTGLRYDRENIDYGRFELQLPGNRFENGGGIGDIVASLSKPIGPQAFWSVALKLPTGGTGGLLGSGGVDVGAAIESNWKLGPSWSLHGQFALVLQGKPYRLERARSLIDQEALSLGYRANSRDAWTIQWQNEPSSIRTGNRKFDSAHRQLSFGYSRRLANRDELQIFFSEDGDFLGDSSVRATGIAPDFTIGFRWTRRW